MKQIAILGSTGSIGQSTLSIIEKYPERFSVASLAAGQNIETAFEQCKRWRPAVVSMATDETAATLELRLKQAGITGIEVAYGAAGTVRVATMPQADFVVSAIVGVSGLEATYAAVQQENRSASPTKRPWWQPERFSSQRHVRRELRCCRSTPSTMQSINACGRGKSAMYGGSG